MKKHFENIVILLMVVTCLGLGGLAKQGILTMPRWLMVVVIILLVVGVPALAVFAKSVIWPDRASRMAGQSLRTRINLLFVKDEREVDECLLDPVLGKIVWDGDRCWSSVDAALPLQIEADWSMTHEIIRPEPTLLDWARRIASNSEAFLSAIADVTQKSKHGYPDWSDEWTSSIDFISLFFKESSPMGALYYKGCDGPAVFVEFDTEMRGQLFVTY